MTEQEKQEIRNIVKEELAMNLQPAKPAKQPQEHSTAPAPVPATPTINVETVSPAY